MSQRKAHLRSKFAERARARSIASLHARGHDVATQIQVLQLFDVAARVFDETIMQTRRCVNLKAIMIMI